MELCVKLMEERKLKGRRREGRRESKGRQGGRYER